MKDGADKHDEGDFVTVARCGSPTEAHVMQGTLASAGLDAHVADANVAQGHPWLTGAIGGVRVLVPAAQLAAAQRTLESFRQGELELEGERATPAPLPTQTLASPVFSPDAAAAWSLLLTPAFGAGLHLLNARTLHDQHLLRLAWPTFIGLLVASGVAIVWAMRMAVDVSAPFRGSLGVSLLTLIWYFTAGQVQSKQLIARHGPRYPRRPILVPAIAVALALSAIASGLAEFAPHLFRP